MHFRAAEVETFLKVFNDNKTAIRNFPGCSYMDLLKDVNALNTFATISHWDNVEDLERYRQSALFQSVWVQVRKLFSARAEAFTLEKF
jgi:quinol monooxygenase YgiN